MSHWDWSPYVTVAERKLEAKKAMEKLRKKGQCIRPVEVAGRAIARSFWGKGWCSHLESFSDYENRLPRGRSYVRNGSVCHLEISAGQILAMVSGSKMYTVSITVKKLPAARWEGIKGQCTGRVGSMLELLQGKLSAEVMAVVAHRENGLFPLPGEMSLDCSCPDWASMCKHVAAVLYGVGHRLDAEPEILFTLRGVDAHELISAPVTLIEKGPGARTDTLGDETLADIFGIDLDTEAMIAPAIKTPPPASKTGKPGASPIKASPVREIAKSPSVALRSKNSKASSKTKAKPFSPTGSNIRKLRTALRFSVAEFAERIGASVTTVQRWESSRSKCKLQTRFLLVLNELHTGQQNGK